MSFPANECRMRELAGWSVLGGLTAAEQMEVDAHLAAGCEVCRAEARQAGDLAAELASGVEATPPASLRSRVLSAVAGASQLPGVVFQSGGVRVARSAELPWLSLSPGVDYKVLHRDKVRRYNTMLFRLEPGAHFPAHRHADVEELMVLSGDLRVAGVVMGSGDYCRADVDSVHGRSYSEFGCTVLLMASSRNEVLV
jgi:anti-sigma factor ChrR (cupin superfamily)